MFNISVTSRVQLRETHNRIPCSAASELDLHCLRMSVLWYAGLELVDEVNSGLDHVSACSAGSRLISYEDITRFNIFTMHSTLSTLTTDDISVFCLAFPTEWGSWRAMQVVSKGGGWHGVSGVILFVLWGCIFSP